MHAFSVVFEKRLEQYNLKKGSCASQFFNSIVRMLFKELAITLTNHVNNGYNIVYYIDYRVILIKALKLGYGASEIKPLKKIFLNENIKTNWTKSWLMLLKY